VSRQGKYLGSIRSVTALVAVTFAIYFGPVAVRLYQVIHLHDEERIVENFLNMDRVFPVRTMRAPEETFEFKQSFFALPETFSRGGKDYVTEDYLEDTQSTGMLVLRGDVNLYEKYWLGHRENGHHISWSVAKSFVGALVGIAVAERKIKSIDEPITTYLPEFEGTGYDEVPIKDLLQMSSGVRFNEDHRDYESDINRLNRTIAFGTSIAKFAKSLTRDRKPGVYHQYVSIDTQVLGMLIARVTGESLAGYMQRKIWDPLQMEHDAKWLLDSTDTEVALGGLNASMRDYARFGLLYLNHGRFGGQQIVPTQWVRDSTMPAARHLLPGKDNPASASSWGYGYQWWVPEPYEQDFTAAGIYNQYIYVNPKAHVVIVKTSATRGYLAERQLSKDLHIAMFRAIAASAAVTPSETMSAR
jgi:CubicO group peptidase (beta-lactamase class C family)